WLFFVLSGFPHHWHPHPEPSSRGAIGGRSAGGGAVVLRSAFLADHAPLLSCRGSIFRRRLARRTSVCRLGPVLLHKHPQELRAGRDGLSASLLVALRGGTILPRLACVDPAGALALADRVGMGDDRSGAVEPVGFCHCDSRTGR